MRMRCYAIVLQGWKQPGAWWRALFFAGLAVLILVSGCRQLLTPTVDPRFDSVIDRSFITDQPCAAPCWYGLEIGKSTAEEVRHKLWDLPFVDPGSVEDRKDPLRRWLLWNCVYSRYKSCGAAGISEDRLEFLRIDIAYELYMEEVVSRLGSPDEIAIALLPPGGGGQVILQWREKKIGVGWFDIYDNTLYKHLASGEKFPRGVKAHYAIYGSSIGPKCGREEKCIPWPGFE